MNKKFVFVNIALDQGEYTGVNHGIAFLVPILKRYSYAVNCINIHREISCHDLLNRINRLNPSIVGFSLTSLHLKYLVKYSRILLEKYPDLLQIAGGAGPTVNPEEILTQSSIKGVCVGEGEVPFNSLLHNIEKGKDIFSTEGFYWHIDGKIKKNPIPPFLPDLSAVDYPDYSIFEKDLIYSKVFTMQGYRPVILSRGCPNSCYYCCSTVIRNLYPSQKGYFRIPDVGYSIGLIERILEQYAGTRFIDFQDDLLVADKEWFKHFAEEYHKKIGTPYRARIRSEFITPDAVKLLEYSGCRSVYLGIESGNETLRKHILNRNDSNDSIIEKTRMIKDAGIELFTFFMTGYPFETRKEMRDSYEFIKRIEPDHGICTFFYPYRGTRLYELCRKNSLLKSDTEMSEITVLTKRPSIKMGYMHEKICCHFKRRITDYINKRNRLAEIGWFGFK